ncbi:hypothetical protein IOQ59_00055 [Pontibacterium sp. N1Y112]|uniref:AAA+ ATPase domain-containing protein n=1 Tax=Pontibacterium sinense TaxID=2781979 RepID=A0A8J7F5X5_9GAMM|nr:hypothetical protein [Pontibacterium sinense]MBE9395650.1 hypothetical protein [Pontibacterium sinense]
MNGHLQLIVVKEKQLSNPDRGICKILFVRDENGNLIPVEREKEFSTGGVWISKGYESIENNFHDGELFLLENYYPRDDSDRESGADSKIVHHSHWATGGSAKALDKNELVPIINTTLPEVGTGLLEIYSRPPRGDFFIKEGGDIYGPFTASVSGEEVIATPSQINFLNLSTHHIVKISISDLDSEGYYLPSLGVGAESNIVGYIPSLRDLSRLDKEKRAMRDYINDSQLVTFVAKHSFGKRNLVGRKGAEALKQGLSEMRRKDKAFGSDERIVRLEKLIDRYLAETDVGSEMIGSYLSSKDGREFLKSQLETNPRLVEEHAQDLIQHNKAREQAEGELNEIKARKEREKQQLVAISDKVAKAKLEAEEEIEKIREKTKEQAQDQLRAINQDLEQQIEAKRDEVESIDLKKKELLKEQRLLESLAGIQEEIRYQERKKKELDDAVDTQEKVLKNPELPKEVTQLKTILDILHGRVYDSQLSVPKFERPKKATKVPDDSSELVQQLVEHFEDTDGRSFTFEEMANLVISVQQSFLTVLKGRPGTGKTSTAIRLSQAYNLSPEFSCSDSFLNIPVSRGWMSGRDFLGFYNSLKGIYQASKTGIYQFLRQGEIEGANDFLRMVLLDEANLSPIEHYWSDFLAMCDPEGRYRKIDTGASGADRFLSVPENLRFIATINNDNTTEPLSPRLCDRVPVISMDVSGGNGEIVAAATSILDGAVPYTTLDNMFGCRSEIESEMPLDLVNFISQMELRDNSLGSPIIVSQRKRNAMHAYCDRAQNLTNSRTAVDFALSQHALPLVNGHGKAFKSRLEKLHEHASNNSLVRTASLLEVVLSDGENFVGNYSFL